MAVSVDGGDTEEGVGLPMGGGDDSVGVTSTIGSVVF
jgi:hypothetical protein